MVPFDLKMHAITLGFAQGVIHACKVEYMSLTFKYKSMKFTAAPASSRRLLSGWKLKDTGEHPTLYIPVQKPENHHF